MTATIIESDVDTDVISLLDFSYAPQCEYETFMEESHCDAEAEYKMVLSCCAETWLMCEDHMLQVVTWVKRARLPVHDENAGGCGAGPIHFTIIERL